MGESRYGKMASRVKRVLEIPRSKIMTRLRVLLMGTRVIATAVWMRAS